MSSILDIIEAMGKDVAAGNKPEHREIVCGTLAFKSIPTLPVCGGYLVSQEEHLEPEGFYFRDRIGVRFVAASTELVLVSDKRERVKTLLNELIDLLL